MEKTHIYWAACNGDIDIVKILAPLTDNPNAPDKYGNTPIHKAAQYGHTEIIKILGPLTDKPNSTNISGKTPSVFAKNEEIRGILENFKTSKKHNTRTSKK